MRTKKKEVCEQITCILVLIPTCTDQTKREKEERGAEERGYILVSGLKPLSWKATVLGRSHRCGFNSSALEENYLINLWFFLHSGL